MAAIAYGATSIIEHFPSKMMGARRVFNFALRTLYKSHHLASLISVNQYLVFILIFTLCISFDFFIIDFSIIFIYFQAKNAFTCIKMWCWIRSWVIKADCAVKKFFKWHFRA